MINDELRDAIVAGAQRGRAAARSPASYGMITLRHDGFRKVREGLTSLEEVIQICGDVSEQLRTQASPSTAAKPPAV